MILNHSGFRLETCTRQCVQSFRSLVVIPCQMESSQQRIERFVYIALAHWRTHTSDGEGEHNNN